MKTSRTLVLVGLVGGLLTTPVFAQFTGFIGNISSNSSDWTTAILGAGGLINSSINFDTAPTGAFNPNTYSGVTFSGTGFGTVANGAGPGQGNTSSTPLSTGEGQHPSSNYLLSDSGNDTVTLTFNSPVFGAGVTVIDNYNIGGTNLKLEAFNGTTSLGVVNAPNFNFQANNEYFIGLTSGAGDISSITLTHTGAATGDVIGLDNFVYATTDSRSLTPVPEPSTYAIFGAATLGLLVASRRFRRKG